MAVEPTPQRLTSPETLPAAAPSPFKFLDAYTASDKARFFGRETEQQRLVELIFRSKLILVYGQSGTGKSSLVQCGLAKALSEADYFPVVVRRRGDLPASLLATLRSVAGDAEAPAEPVALVEYLSRLALRPVYLVFDQFEELFISGTPDEQSRFIALLKALYDAVGTTKILIVMREDYLAHLYPFENALPGLFDFRLRVEPMSEKNLHAAIVGTCREAGIAIDDEAETVSRICRNIQGSGGSYQLPYLQVYLDRLWRTAQAEAPGGTLTFTPALVKRVGAIADVLERFLDEQKRRLTVALPPDDAPAVGRVLEAFVTDEGTRCEQPLNALPAATGVAAALLSTILDGFERARILRHEETTYELAHDSLARVIDRGRSAEQRQLADLLRRLREDYRYFLEKNKAEDVLLSPRRVGEILLFEKSVRQQLTRNNPEGRAVWRFVTDSRKRNERLERQKISRLRRTVAIVVSLLVLAVVAVVLAIHQWNDSNQKSVVFQAREMDPLQSLVMEAWAYEQERNSVSENALFNTFYNQQPYEAVLDAGAPVVNARFSPDGRFILLFTKDQRVQVFDGTGQQRLDSVRVGAEVVGGNATPDLSAVLLFTTRDDKTTAHLWNRRTRRLSPLLGGQPMSVGRFSPDGKTIFCGAEDGTVSWLNADGQPVARRTLSAAARSVEYSGDGRWVATVLTNGRAYLWDAATHQPVDSLSLRGEEIVSVRFFGEKAQMFVTQGSDHVLRWLPDAKTPANRVRMFSSGPSLTDVTPDGKTALLGEEEALFFLDNTGAPPDSLDRREAWESLSLAPDGRAFLAVVNDNQVQIVNRHGEVESHFSHASPIDLADFSPDGRRVLTLTSDGRVYLWSRRDPRRTVLRHAEQVRTFALAPDGQTAVTASGSTLVRWSKRGERLDSAVCPKPLVLCKFSPDGKTVYTLTNDQRAQAFQPGAGNAVRNLPFTGVLDLFPSPDGQRLLVSTKTGLFSARPDGSGGQPVGVTLPDQAGVVAFAPDFRTVLLMAETGAVVWQADTRQLRKLAAPALLGARFTPDGQAILAQTDKFEARWLDLNGRALGPSLPNSMFYETRLSPDGRTALGWDLSAVAYLWDRPTGRLLTLLHRGPVQDAQFSPDGRQVLVRTESGLHLWNLQGQPLMATERRCQHAEFSPDGSLLVTLDGEAVSLWPSPANVVPWLRQTYDPPTLDALQRGVKRQYGIRTSYAEAVWQPVKTLFGR